MAFEELLVQAHELSSAAAEIANAAEIYEDAVETAKNAADDLAGKWEGAARDAFVQHQANVYQWHMMILGIVREIVEVINKFLVKYNEMEEAVKSLVDG